MTKDKALKLALEALNSGADVKIGRVVWTEYDSCLISDAITAIKETLAQPAQEPVEQWQKRHHLWTEGEWENAEEHDAKQWRDKAQGWDIRALYTKPPQQEPRNFCSRCGKRTADLTVIHTCTPPEGGHQ
jgi:hypothetical protein